MAKDPIRAEAERRARVAAELRRDVQELQKGYRMRALGLFPHICARCAREFSGTRMRELTVHHKDLNHDHNPPDGSNWELLCIYCHEEEHLAHPDAGREDDDSIPDPAKPSPISNPFAGLGDLFGGAKK